MRVFRISDLGIAANDLASCSGFVMDDGDVRHSDVASEVRAVAYEEDDTPLTVGTLPHLPLNFTRQPITAGATRRR